MRCVVRSHRARGDANSRRLAPHGAQPVHVALEALRVAEAHLAQESQEDEDAAEAEEDGMGTSHGQDAMRIGRHAKVRRPTTTQTERRGTLFQGAAVSISLPVNGLDPSTERGATIGAVWRPPPAVVESVCRVGAHVVI